MIIVIDKPGQMGNRMWALLNIIGFAKETQQIVIISHDYFQEYLLNFEDLTYRILKEQKVFFVNKWIYKTITNKYIHKIITLLKILSKQRLKLSFTNSWNIDSKYAQKYTNDLRVIFKPTQKICQEVELLLDIFDKEKLIIGVHIRRGDYQHWKNGKYYYAIDVYAKFMKEISETINGKILFYLFSNEDISDYDFGVDCFFKPNTEAVFDMWAMSKCNYLIGPPSTFSMFASFWNRTPIHFIYDKDQKFKIEDFQHIVAQNVFANEKRLLELD